MNVSTDQAHNTASDILAQFETQLGDTATPFSVMVRFQLHDGLQDAVVSAFAVACAETVKEDGVIAFDLNQEAADPTRFVVYERWRSLTDFEAHVKTPYVTLLRNQLDRLINGVPEFHLLRPAKY